MAPEIFKKLLPIGAVILFVLGASLRAEDQKPSAPEEITEAVLLMQKCVTEVRGVREAAICSQDSPKTWPNIWREDDAPRVNDLPPRERPAANEAWLVLPKDRCKSGWLYFGEVKCPALGRGVTFEHPPVDPGEKITPAESSEKTKYKQGTYPDGKSCYYIDQHRKSGSTPLGTYWIWRDGYRGKSVIDGVKAYHFGKRRIACLASVSGGRGLLRVHSDEDSFPADPAQASLRPLIYMRPSHGCVKIDGTDDQKSCQVLFNDWLRQNGAAKDGDGSCSDNPRKVKFVVKEATP